MSLTHLLVPTFTRMLTNLGQWLDKAEAHQRATGGDVEALMSMRLAADMYPLASQVRFTCFQALEPTYRLRGLAIPEHWLGVRQDGWEANERPGSPDDARGCVAEALAVLGDLQPTALDGESPSAIELDLPNGIVFDLTREQYARDWALPQFYFHCVTAYAILRHHGIELGKADYVAHMLAFIRPGSMPQG
nr:DUF1993 domain-containing protein [uncultured Pseudomonas sp.]